ncbi:uncharacterized protein LOC130743971 [Lotus japonicus]|uniref:uncharacterized protein LOC130743971 n=1 Tax=Lotus japonicus TaxID=34305 RepID=UPI0025892E80|nr:uncharacterized protein LOC130743971 [Lotus japonicus]
MDPVVTPFHTLSQLSLWPHIWTIKVRVIGLWKTPEDMMESSHSSLNMVLIDREAVKIEAYVCKEDPMTKNIVPGCVYKFSIFQVTCNHGDNRVTNHRYKLLLHSRTLIFPSVEPSIPFDGYDFLDIGHIRRNFDTFTYLIGYNLSQSMLFLISAVDDFETTSTMKPMDTGIKKLTLNNRMEKLKILNLSHSQHLTKTPDFSCMPNLEKLVLKDCPSLLEVSHSIGHLNKVVLINLKDCIRLRNLPRSIYKLKSLKTLILSGCLMIDKLEEDVEQMESLTTLIADNTAITRVPFSLVRSKSIGYISLCGHEGFSRDVFPSIIWSWMSPTNNLSSLVQTYTGMSSLVSLNVSNSSSEGVSSIPVDLPKLQSLWIESGSELQLSRDAERILDALYATNSSKNLQLTATTSKVSNMETTALMECSCQVHDSGSKGSLKFLLFQMGMNCLATSILKESILQKMAVRGTGVSLLPGDNYPDWLNFNCEGSSVIFEVPEVNGRSLKSMMCVVHSSTADDTTSDGLKNVLVINCTKNTIQLYKRNALASFEDEEWQRVVSNIEPGNKVKVVVVFENRFTVKKTTIYLIYVEPIEEKMEYCNAPCKNEIVSSGNEIESDVWRSSAHVESKDDCKQKQKRRKIE